jgi:citrate lyase subunit beta/citryl-CoA lyase
VVFRSWLYVPGDRPERFRAALAAGSDAVLIDLLDAVAVAHKAGARAAVASFVASLAAEPSPPPVWVRVNDLGGPDFFADLAALADLPGLAGLQLPRVESAAQVTRVAGLCDKNLHLLIESARGLELAFEIATVHRSVAGIGLGEAHLRAELGLTGEEGLLWARGRIVVAARAAGLPAPAMPVYPQLSDLDGLRESCRAGRRLGFAGRVALHPLQLPVIVESFRPSPDEVEPALAASCLRGS